MSLLDVVSVGCLLLASIVLLARRRVGRLLVDLSAPDDTAAGFVEQHSDFVVAPRFVERPKLGAASPKPPLQAVTLNDNSDVRFEPALPQCTRAARNAFVTTLRDLSTVSEVHVARVRMTESGRVAERVLVVAVGSSMEAAEAHTALSMALEGVMEGVLPVWFLRHDSPRLKQLRNAGCVVLRRRVVRSTSLAAN